MNESRLSVRVNPANPNHHLWDNNGTWFVHYTRHEPGFTKRRVRASLNTSNLQVARTKRDTLLEDKTNCAGRTVRAKRPQLV